MTASLLERIERVLSMLNSLDNDEQYENQKVCLTNDCCLHQEISFESYEMVVCFVATEVDSK